VPQGRVLIVEADEWVTTLVRRFLSDASYQTDVASTAREGFERAVSTQPDLLLVDVVLPDIDGFWVTKRIRADKERLATTPIILVSQRADSYARLEGLSLGADVFLSAPFRHEEVIAQVDALLGMAKRLRGKRDSIYQDSPLTSSGAALQGDISQISIPTLMTMLEMERRTGTVYVRGPGNVSASIELEEGAVTIASLDKSKSPVLTVFRTVVTWNSGKYAFEPAEKKNAPPRPRTPTSLLLLEAMRLNDESARE
jgi:DNA-binding response OmpR family regulator